VTVLGTTGPSHIEMGESLPLRRLVFITSAYRCATFLCRAWLGYETASVVFIRLRSQNAPKPRRYDTSTVFICPKPQVHSLSRHPCDLLLGMCTSLTK
jgi:hypothetical protein